MKNEFKKRLEEAKKKKTGVDLEKLVPPENRDYLPKEKKHREPLAPTKFKQNYKCYACGAVFEDYVGMFGGYNNPICPKCQKSKGY